MTEAQIKEREFKQDRERRRKRVQRKTRMEIAALGCGLLAAAIVFLIVGSLLQWTDKPLTFLSGVVAGTSIGLVYWLIQRRKHKRKT